MADDLINRQAAIEKAFEDMEAFRAAQFQEWLDELTPVDAVELTAAELKYLINDTIAYISKMEDSGRNKLEFGYDSRKALLEKLQRFEKEHFPEMRCSNG